MEEEFQESEVIFTDHVDCCQGNSYSGRHEKDRHRVLTLESRDVSCNANKKSRKTKPRKPAAGSVPVDIPNNVFRLADLEHDLEGEFDDEDELVPPHVIVGRRIFAGKMAFSLCSGNGRTLKGRDLSQVRNSILRMTGFLES